MEFENKIVHVDNKEYSGDEISLREIIEKFNYHWKWYFLGMLVSLIFAFIYLRYTHNMYNVSTTIFIDDKEQGGLSSEIAAFEDLGVLGGNKKTTIVNETGVLKSRSLMEAVIKDLGINISYFEKGKVINSEIYKNDIPFKINFFAMDSAFYELDTMFRISIKSRTKYILKNSEKDSVKEALFGTNVKTDFGEINITPIDIEVGKTIIVKITTVTNVANEYRSRIVIEPESKKSSLLILSLTDEVKQKAIDILNNLVFQYNYDAIKYKTIISENTDGFINDRIADISVDLTIIDKGVEDFKIKNKLTDLGVEASLDLNSNAELQKNILDLNTQIKLVVYIQDYITDNEQSLIPANLGLNDAATNLNTNAYNILLLERNRIIKSSSSLNPTVINLDEQLAILKQSIEQSLTNLISSLSFSLSELRNREYQIKSKRAIAPQQEREYQDIKRRQVIVESLYLYLLEKREENAISLGIPVPNAKIIDKAFGSDRPVSPKPLLIYSVACIIGLIIPFLIISIISLVDNKIHTYDDVEALVKAPIIGDIPNAKSKNKVIISDQNHDKIAESFRSLRTNLNFMLSNEKDDAKTILITSTIGGEGKTFIAINLAAVIASTNKKVLLIGADLRKPKMNKYLKIQTTKGLTNYLAGMDLNISDLLISDKKINIDVLIAGEIPPNPSELLMNGRFEDVLAFGKENYDFIIVDTPPVSLVTDSLLLSKYADLSIYVIRANYLDKRLLKTPLILYENGRLPNMALLLNASDHKKDHYGYSYGYYEN